MYKIFSSFQILMPVVKFYLRISEPYILFIIKKIFLKKNKINSNNNSIYSDLLVNKVNKHKIKEYIKNIIIIISYFFPKNIINQTKINEKDKIEKLIYKFNKNQIKLLVNEDIDYLDFIIELYFINYFSKLFDKKLFNFLKISFDIKQNLYNKHNFGEGGSSGEYFFLTHDQKFVLKTILQKEFLILKLLIDKYFLYINNNKNSFITKILGLIKIKFTELNEELIFIIMENKFNINLNKIHRKYDIKGSKSNRKVTNIKTEKILKKKNSSFLKTLKDLDFENLENNSIIINDKNLKIKIYNQLEKDIYFFYENEIIDYSFVIAIIIKNNISQEEFNNLIENNNVIILEEYIYVFGLLDYLQYYDFCKKFEKIYKKTMKLNFKLDTSTQDPWFYKNRILKHLKNILKIN